LATVLVAGQDFPSHARWDGGGGAAAGAADHGVTLHPFGFGTAKFALSCMGLEGHSALFLVDGDLDRGKG